MAQNFANVLNEDESTAGSPTIIVVPSGPTVSTWAQVLTNGNLSGANDAIMTGTQQLQFQDQVVRIGSTTAVSATGNAGAVGIGLTPTIGANSAGSVAIGRTITIGASSSNAIAIGNAVTITASSAAAILIGNNMTMGGSNAGVTVIGNQTVIGAFNGETALGNVGTVNGVNAIKIGSGASAIGNNNISIGGGSSATSGTNNTTVGDSAQITFGSRNIALGSGSLCNTASNNSLALGDRATSQGSSQVVIGNQCGLNSTSANSIRIGAGTAGVVSGSQLISIGRNQTVSTSDNSVVIGDTTNVGATTTGCVVIGNTAQAAANAGASVSIGNNARSNGATCVAIGSGSSAGSFGANGISIGVTSAASGLNSIGIGNTAQVIHTNAVCIGNGVISVADNEFRLGNINNLITGVGILDRWRSNGFKDATFTKDVLSFSAGVGYNDFMKISAGIGNITIDPDAASTSANININLITRGGTSRVWNPNGFMQAGKVEGGGCWKAAGTQTIPSFSGALRIQVPDTFFNESFSGTVYNDTANDRVNLAPLKTYIVTASGVMKGASLANVVNAVFLFKLTYFNGLVADSIGETGCYYPSFNTDPIGFSVSAVVKTAAAANQWVALDIAGNTSLGDVEIQRAKIVVVMQ